MRSVQIPTDRRADLDSVFYPEDDHMKEGTG